MTDEIKEVINKMKLQYYKKKNINLDNNDICLLLDYITNLQEELKISNDNHINLIQDVSGIAKELGLEEDAIIDEIYETITNLQEENKTLKGQLDFIEEQNKHIEKLLKICADYDKEVNRLKEEYILLQNASDKYEDELNERIEIAIEYINHQVLIDYANNNEYNFKDTPTGIDLLNILNGGDK